MLFFDLLSNIGGLLPLQRKTNIDTPVTKLHYTFTATILLVFCALITATNLIGEPILCTFSNHPHLKDDVVNSYCWIHSTYTLASHYHNDQSPSVIHPGISPNFRKNQERIYHAYYQWVPFVLFLQAITFYAPHWLWSTWEGGRVASASQELQSFVMNKDERRDRIHLVADYLHASLRHHNMYAIKYLFCELLNFINTVVNILLLNKFFKGKFISYGTEFFSFEQDEEQQRTHPKLMLFPRVTKCVFNTVGPSGTTQNLDILCVLPHSIINEKVYLFLWVWLWVLLTGTALAFIWRCLVFFVPIVRRHLLTTYVRDPNVKDIQILSSNLQLGDYFLLYLLQKNISDMAFGDLVKELSDRIAGKASNSIELDEKVAPGGRGYFHMNELQLSDILQVYTPADCKLSNE